MLATATRERRWNHNTTQVRDSSESWTLPWLLLFDYAAPREEDIGVEEKAPATVLVLDDEVDTYATDALMGWKTGDAAPGSGTVAARFEERALIRDDHSLDIMAHNHKTTFYSATAFGFDSKMVTCDQSAGLTIADWGSEESKGAGILPRPVNRSVSEQSFVVHALQGISASYRQLKESRLRYTLLAQLLTQLLTQLKENKLRDSLLDRLREWQQEPEDWGPGTRWPAEQAFEEAIAFVSKLPESALPELDMGIAEDGEINFSWNTDDIIIDLGFYGTRPCSYFARDKRDGRKMRDSAFDPAEGLPDQLRALFVS